jgi:cell division septation protein DedD
MPEQNVREIQLGGKQLVFLFMASVVLAVAIFLLGISVGRGVGGPTEETATAAAGEPAPPAPAEMPPPTETTPADQSYHDKLQDQSAPKAQPAPPSEAAKPAATDSTSVPVTPPAAPAAAKPTPQTAAAPPGAPPAPVTTSSAPTVAKPSPAGARGTSPAPGWYVQVAAFKSKENADRQVSQLKAKGYAATVLADPGSLFRVRIGPFQERTEASSTAERLKREDNIGATVGR